MTENDRRGEPIGVSLFKRLEVLVMFGKMEGGVRRATYTKNGVEIGIFKREFATDVIEAITTKSVDDITQGTYWDVFDNGDARLVDDYERQAKSVTPPLMGEPEKDIDPQQIAKISEMIRKINEEIPFDEEEFNRQNELVEKRIAEVRQLMEDLTDEAPEDEKLVFLNFVNSIDPEKDKWKGKPPINPSSN